MKILILADPSSSHTIKWVNSIHEKGINVVLFGLSKYDRTQYDTSIRIESLQTPDGIKSKLNGSFLKIIYAAALPKLKKIIRTFKPDLLHAHYAASYGLLGAFSGFHPLILSVWGIDILTFPNNSIFHKKIVEYTLKKADKILATSEYLATETNNFTEKNIQITPFGIDCEQFKPITQVNYSRNDIVIGTVKSLEAKYGIEYLIESFAVLCKKYPDMSLKLLLIGGGSLQGKFQKMINDFGISDSSKITGHIPFDKIVDYHNQLTIAVYVSRVESFGVSILESSACGKPVIVSDVGGLTEVVENEVTGLIVKANSISDTTSAIERLILSEETRTRFGIAGRVRVKDKFDWNKNVLDMINIYRRMINK